MPAKTFLHRALQASGVCLFLALPVWAATQTAPEPQAAPIRLVAAPNTTRPRYDINASIDYDLLTLKSMARVTVPATSADPLRDVVFFLFANAGGVGGDDERRKNLVVDSVSLDDAKIPFKLDGAVLRVQLPSPRSKAFTLEVQYHGIVPRSAPGSGGLADMMGGLSGDIGGLLGGGTGQQAKPKNVDYGLYTYGNGILSLGSFWYPSLAVRQGGKWMDEAPEGLGDVGFAEISDFDVRLETPATVRVVTTGRLASLGKARAIKGEEYHHRFTADDVRDFAVVMSEDFVTKSKPFDVGGKQVTVEAFTTKANAAKADKAIDIAGHALQVFAKRFGPYPYDSFKVVESPIKGGAGGMEYSGMTGIASMLYSDWGEQLKGLTDALGVGDLSKALGDAEEGANPAADMLTGMLGQQKEMLDSVFETTIAHEVAHQWWAIGVGSDSIRAPWLDESLTNYCAMLYFEDRYGREKAQTMMDTHLKMSYQTARMLGVADAPANLKTSAYQGNLQYGAVVYGKGALFYDALRGEIGDAAFFAALRDYHDRYENRLAGASDLIKLFQTHAPPAKKPRVGALYARWIEGKNGDADISGGQAMGLQDLLGGLMRGGMEE